MIQTKADSDVFGHSCYYIAFYQFCDKRDVCWLQMQGHISLLTANTCSCGCSSNGAVTKYTYSTYINTVSKW